MQQAISFHYHSGHIFHFQRNNSWVLSDTYFLTNKTKKPDLSTECSIFPAENFEISLLLLQTSEAD